MGKTSNTNLMDELDEMNTTKELNTLHDEIIKSIEKEEKAKEAKKKAEPKKEKKAPKKETTEEKKTEKPKKEEKIQEFTEKKVKKTTEEEKEETKWIIISFVVFFVCGLIALCIGAGLLFK